jgi:acyl-CoA synthetase (AMP-forming)/AMP-acid ligase II
MMRASAALAEYLGAFDDPGEPFLAYYAFAPDGTVRREDLTRGEFWSLSRRAAHVLCAAGLAPGDAFVHYFSANRVADLAFRVAAAMTGAVPVTINWQADTLEAVAYKVGLTESRLVLFDAGVPKESIEALRAEFPALAFFPVEGLAAEPELAEEDFCADAHLGPDASRIIIFTSGTTGRPKGVRLPYRSYAANRATFESFLEIRDGDLFAQIVVNPMHHTNSTAITDWALRRPRTRLCLIERYSTPYWRLVAEIGMEPFDRIVAPTVSRHFDFLESLRQEGKLPVALDRLKEAMRRVEFLIGSAPVGPTTVKRLQEYAGRIPLVRFGSTETCLQVMGTPRSLSEAARLEAFERGWAHAFKGVRQGGYYVGRPHPGWTECRVVRGITRGRADCFVDCDEGEPGYLITRGPNLMSGYVKDDDATREAMHEDGWYSGLRDICFWLTNARDGGRDYYWMSRDSALLIRGGANYSCDQINAELKAFIGRTFGLSADAFDVAVAGLRLTSEHEDECCVTVELTGEEAKSKRAEIERRFLAEAKTSVSKGARPDRLRFATIPRNFKGALLVSELKEQCRSAFAASRT